MNPPRRYYTPAELVDRARAARNRAALATLAGLAAIAAAVTAILHFVNA